MTLKPGTFVARVGSKARRVAISRHVKSSLRRLGVVFDGSLVLYGRPIISVAERSHVTLGRNVVLCSDPRYTALGVSRPVILRTLAAGAEIEIGNDTGLSGTVICAAISVKIGDRCLLGADVCIADTDFHPISPAANRRWAPTPLANEEDRVIIGDDVFIGTGVNVLKGVKIGDGAVIGARSVVVSDVPPMTIVAGIPARIIGKVDVT